LRSRYTSEQLYRIASNLRTKSREASSPQPQRHAPNAALYLPRSVHPPHPNLARLLPVSAFTKEDVFALDQSCDSNATALKCECNKLLCDCNALQCDCNELLCDCYAQEDVFALDQSCDGMVKELRRLVKIMRISPSPYPTCTTTPLTLILILTIPYLFGICNILSENKTRSSQYDCIAAADFVAVCCCLCCCLCCCYCCCYCCCCYWCSATDSQHVVSSPTPTPPSPPPHESASPHRQTTDTSRHSPHTTHPQAKSTDCRVKRGLLSPGACLLGELRLLRRLLWTCLGLGRCHCRLLRKCR
jgi:hypothetical protein